VAIASFGRSELPPVRLALLLTTPNIVLPNLILGITYKAAEARLLLLPKGGVLKAIAAVFSPFLIVLLQPVVESAAASSHPASLQLLTQQAASLQLLTQQVQLCNRRRVMLKVPCYATFSVR